MLFPAIVEFAQDKGMIGHVLSQFPTWFLKEADRWAEQEADYKERHQDPNRLPAPNPWQFFIDAPAVAEKQKAVFRAARSQVFAMRHLVRMTTKVASLNTDWQQEAVKARGKNERRSVHAANKVANALMPYALVRADARKHAKERPELLPQMEEWERQR